MRKAIATAWFFEEECCELIEEECALSRGKAGLPEFVAGTVVQAIYTKREQVTCIKTYGRTCSGYDLFMSALNNRIWGSLHTFGTMCGNRPAPPPPNPQPELYECTYKGQPLRSHGFGGNEGGMHYLLFILLGCLPI